MTLATGPAPAMPGTGDHDDGDRERVSESAVSRFAGWIRHAPAERAPLVGIPGVWGAAEIMHVAGMSPVFTGAATIAAAGLAYGIGERRQHRHQDQQGHPDGHDDEDHQDDGSQAGEDSDARTPGEDPDAAPPEASAYRRHPRMRGAELAAATGGVGAWATMAAIWGPAGGPDHLVGIIYGLGAIGGYWWLRAHEAVRAARARRDAAAAAAAEAAARAEELRKKHAYWHKLTSLPPFRELFGSHLMKPVPTRNGEEWIIDLYSADLLARRADPALPDKLAGYRHLRKGMVEVWPDPEWPYRLHILWRLRDPWDGGGADGLVWHPWHTGEYDPDAPFAELVPPSPTIRKPVVFGADPETGMPLQVPLWDSKGAKRIAIVGSPESGKSMLADTLRERITACPDARLIQVNLSKALEDSWWAELAAAAAIGGEPDAEARALAILDFGYDAIKLRPSAPARRNAGARVHVPTPDEPLFVIMLDECDKVVDDPVRRRRLEDISSKCRSEGWALVMLTQRAVQGWIPPGVRANLSHLIFGKMRPSELRRLAGSDGITLPDISDYGRGNAGIFGVCEHPTFAGMPCLRGRAFYWGDNSPGLIRLIRARAAVQQPYVLEPALAPLVRQWAAITGGKPMAASDERYDLVTTPDGRTAPGVAGVRARLDRVRQAMSGQPAGGAQPASGSGDGAQDVGQDSPDGPLPEADQERLWQLLVRPEGVTSREAAKVLPWSHTTINQQLAAWRQERRAEIRGEGSSQRWHAAGRARLRVVPDPGEAAPETAVSGEDEAREPDQVYEPDALTPHDLVMLAASWGLRCPDLASAAENARWAGIPEDAIAEAMELLAAEPGYVVRPVLRTDAAAGMTPPPWLAELAVRFGISLDEDGEDGEDGLEPGDLDDEDLDEPCALDGAEDGGEPGDPGDESVNP